MNDGSTDREKQAEVKAALNLGVASQSALIPIGVPRGTPDQGIQEPIFQQEHELAGVQLRAAIALGITAGTVSRVLRRPVRRSVPMQTASDYPPSGTRPPKIEDIDSRQINHAQVRFIDKRPQNLKVDA